MELAVIMFEDFRWNAAQYKPYFDLYKREYIKAGRDLAKMQLGAQGHELYGDKVIPAVKRALV